MSTFLLHAVISFTSLCPWGGGYTRRQMHMDTSQAKAVLRNQPQWHAPCISRKESDGNIVYIVFKEGLSGFNVIPLPGREF